MRREEIEAAVARHAERVRAEGGTPRTGPGQLPPTSPAERKAKRDDAESRRARAAGDRAVTGQEQRLIDGRLGDVDTAARAAWAQVAFMADEMHADARMTMAAAIHASRAAEVARTRRTDDSRRAAERARDRVPGRRPVGRDGWDVDRLSL